MDSDMFSDFATFPVASTSAAPASDAEQVCASTMSTTTTSQQTKQSSTIGHPSRPKMSARPAKSRSKGKGRMMMVKVFYSLSNQRSVPSNASESGTPSQDFLSPREASLAPSPRPDGQQPHRYTCLARTSQPVWVNLTENTRPDGSEGIEFGRVTLKTCLSAICISRPELVSDSGKDYAVSAVDPYEYAIMNPDRTSLAGGEGIMEGKGMLSWGLAEKREGTTVICGRVVPNDRRRSKKRMRREGASDVHDQGDTENEDEDGDDQARDTLELYLQLVERPAFTHDQFLRSMRSFAQPPALASLASDRISPPRASNQPLSGDPVKRKRPRDFEQPLPTPSSATFPIAPYADTTEANLLGAIQKLLPALNGQAGVDANNAAQVLAALRPLADQYGVSQQQNAAEHLAQPNPSIPPARQHCSSSRDVFSIISQSAKGRPSEPSPIDPAEGCGNCRRRKSATWREGPNGSGGLMRVCNACGTFYNRHGYHRDLVVTGAARVSSPTRSTASAPNRALKPRLSAVVESDLAKQRRQTFSSTAGVVLPPSPSKHVGPKSPVYYQYHRTHKSPRHGVKNATSPLKSPRMLSKRPFVSATSPTRADFGSIFGIPPSSPSPVKSDTAQPDYLLTASPGTALDRLFSETSVDMGSFVFGGGDVDDNQKTSRKENLAPAGGGRLHPSTAAVPSEFDSVLSSLRKNFDSRLSSAPNPVLSSPPSSPCVQPRTSSATPGQKGKGPASCGRPAPSVHASYIDSLVPALALNENDSVLDSVKRTRPSTNRPLRSLWLGDDSDDDDDVGRTDEGDRTMTFLNDGANGAPGTGQSHSQQRLDFASLPPRTKRSIFSTRATTSEADFADFGSLPPSSPPALPSDAGGGPTPSDFSSVASFTPDPLSMPTPEMMSTTTATTTTATGGKEQLTMPDGSTVSIESASMDQLLSIFTSAVDNE